MRRSKMPGLLVGVMDGGASGCLERRVMRLLEGRLPWARRWRVVSACVCVAVLGVLSVCVGMLGVRPSLAQIPNTDTTKTHTPGDISGDWQGMHGNERAVLRISKTPNGGWKSVIYNLGMVDMNGPMANTSTTLRGDTFKCVIAIPVATFEGKLSLDGDTITGIWKQGNGPQRMVLVRPTNTAAWELPKFPGIKKAMAADANPSFEAASIKPSDPNAKLGDVAPIRINGQNFRVRGATMNNVIAWAYGVHVKQVAGGPEWLAKDKYDISAVVDIDVNWASQAGNSGSRWRRSCCQTDSESSFITRKKSFSIYALSTGKDGPRNLIKNENDSDRPTVLQSIGPGKETLIMTKTAIADFATIELQSSLLADRPVLDKTGLVGQYDFKLVFAPDPSSPEGQFGGPARADAPTAPDLFTAIQQQLGLKLDGVKAPADVIVIDSIERPTEN